MIAWTVGFYGFAVKWRWIGGIGYATLSIPLMFPILH